MPGFMAVGAYVTSILNVWLFTTSSVFGPPLLPASSAIFLFPVTLLAGGIAAAIAGLLVAVPSFKTRGDYLAIITLAVNYIVKSSIENIQPIGGARGFMGMRNVIDSMQAVVNLPVDHDLGFDMRRGDGLDNPAAREFHVRQRHYCDQG